jgi:hypothetical protein
MFGSQPVGSRQNSAMGPLGAVTRRNGAADMSKVVGEKQW